jgi:hypothetical protein
MKTRIILFIDSIINLALGILLLIFTPGIVKFLGVPSANLNFYPNILGAVLLGIGIALLVEVFKKKEIHIGLGLWGAVSINICGGIVLALWLIFGKLNLPLRGVIFLWILVVILVGISLLELIISLTRQIDSN